MSFPYPNARTGKTAALRTSPPLPNWLFNLIFWVVIPPAIIAMMVSTVCGVKTKVLDR